MALVMRLVVVMLLAPAFLTGCGSSPERSTADTTADFYYYDTGELGRIAYFDVATGEPVATTWLAKSGSLLLQTEWERNRDGRGVSLIVDDIGRVVGFESSVRGVPTGPRVVFETPATIQRIERFVQGERTSVDRTPNSAEESRELFIDDDRGE